jgi:predicted metalloendopeptidase
MLVNQYSQFEPIPGYHVNGELTLGENIADNSGLAIAFKAYKISLKGKKAPVIDGLTGEQRLYMGWAQVWRTKMREQQQILQVKADPHSPGQFRANGTLRNQPGFYDAFKVKQGDKMYLAPQDRVIIW